MGEEPSPSSSLSSLRLPRAGIR